MPLHPTVVVVPIALAVLLAAIDLARLRYRSAELARAGLVTHGLLLAGAILASSTGQSEGGSVPSTPQMLELLYRHQQFATRTTFLVGALFLARAATWRRRDRMAVPAAVASCALLALLLVTGRLGGRLVFEHGAGVRVPPWDVTIGRPLSPGENPWEPPPTPASARPAP